MKRQNGNAGCKSASGSNQRRRQSYVMVRLMTGERDALQAEAGRRGLTVPTLVRSMALGTPLPVLAPDAARELLRLHAECGLKAARAAAGANPGDVAELATEFRELRRVVCGLVRGVTAKELVVLHS